MKQAQKPGGGGIGSDRVRELEACLARAYGFVDDGAASEFAREHMLAEMRKVMGWHTPNVGAMIAELERFANQQ